MNRRQNIQHMGFQMPTGLRTVQRPSNSFFSKPINYNGGNVSPFYSQQAPAPTSRGGILSKLTGGNKSAQAGLLQGAQQQSTRGGLSSLLSSFQSGGSVQGAGSGLSGALSMDNIQKWVGSTQQMINTAQQALPMIQQYGPLVRNFPAMWKLYRSLKTESAENDDKKSDVKKDLNVLSEIEDKPKNVTQDIPKPTRPRTSTPRLYV